MDRRHLALSLVAAAILVGGALAWDTLPSVGHIPDPVHIVGHLVVFAVFAVLVAPDLGFVGTLVAVVAAGLLLEGVQSYGVGIVFLRESLFDTSVNLLGAVGGLAWADPTAARSWLRSSLVGLVLPFVALFAARLGRADGVHTALVVLGALSGSALVEVLRTPPAYLPLLALTSAASVAPVSLRGAFVWFAFAVLFTWARRPGFDQLVVTWSLGLMLLGIP